MLCAQLQYPYGNRHEDNDGADGEKVEEINRRRCRVRRFRSASLIASTSSRGCAIIAPFGGE